MGMLDFLFPVLMAAETRAKIKSEKEWKKEREQSRVDFENWSKEVEYYEDLYTNQYYERGKLYSQMFHNASECADVDGDKFIFDDVVKSCKSYDDTKRSDNSHINFAMFDTIGKRLALAKLYGKLPTITFGNSLFCSFRAGGFYNEEWYGRQEFSYVSQIFHELMQQWHLAMKEYDFPFDLKVINPIDDPTKKIYKRDDGVVVTEIDDFKGRNIYYWDVPTQWKNWVYHKDFTMMVEPLTP